MNFRFQAALLFLSFCISACSPTSVVDGCLDDSDCQSGETCQSRTCRSAASPDAGVADAEVIVDDAGTQCIDNDADGYGADCLLGPDCDDANNTVHTPRMQFVDVDGDGYSVGEGTLLCSGDEAPVGAVFERSTLDDCNDANAEQYVELQGFPDADNDGVTPAEGETFCGDELLPAGYQLFASDPPDCNDDDENASPNVDEVCDGKDNDCDGQADSSAVCPCPVLSLEEGVGLVDEAGAARADRSHPYFACELERDAGEARAFCFDQDNYDLVIIEDIEEFEALRGYAGLARWWTGMNDITTEGRHRFVVPRGGFDGLEIDYEPWLPEQPNSNGDCVQMRSAASEAPGGLNDTDCDNDRFFLCESFTTN